MCEKTTVEIPVEGLVELLESKAKLNVLYSYVKNVKGGYLNDDLIRGILVLPQNEEE